MKIFICKKDEKQQRTQKEQLNFKKTISRLKTRIILTRSVQDFTRSTSRNLNTQDKDSKLNESHQQHG